LYCAVRIFFSFFFFLFFFDDLIVRAGAAARIDIERRILVRRKSGR